MFQRGAVHASRQRGRHVCVLGICTSLHTIELSTSFLRRLSETLPTAPPCPALRSKLQEQEGKLRTAIQDKNNFQLVRLGLECGVAVVGWGSAGMCNSHGALCTLPTWQPPLMCAPHPVAALLACRRRPGWSASSRWLAPRPKS